MCEKEEGYIGDGFSMERRKVLHFSLERSLDVVCWVLLFLFFR